MVKKEPFKFLAILAIVLIFIFLIAELFIFSLSSDSDNIVGMGPGFKVKTGTAGGMVVAAIKAIFNPTPEPLGDPDVLETKDESGDPGDEDDSDSSSEQDKDKGDTVTGDDCPPGFDCQN